MNSFDKLLLKLNAKLESLETKRDSLNEEQSAIFKDINNIKQQEQDILDKLRDAIEQLKHLKSNFSDNRRKFKFISDLLFVFIIISFTITTLLYLNGQIGPIVYISMFALIFSPKFYIFKTQIKREKSFKNQERELTEEQKELMDGLANVRTKIAELNSSYLANQENLDKLNSIIHSLTNKINYIVESKNVAISRMAKEQEPRLNEEFESDDTLRLIRDTEEGK